MASLHNLLRSPVIPELLTVRSLSRCQGFFEVTLTFLVLLPLKIMGSDRIPSAGTTTRALN